MRGKGYCDQCKEVVDAKCPKGHKLPIIGVTVDLIIEHEGKLWLVKRVSHGWALPGGFVEYDETLEEAAEREGREELGVEEITLLRQFHTYGDPDRDRPRRNISVVYVAQVNQVPRPSEEHMKEERIEEVRGFSLAELPRLAFDHNEIIADYLTFKRRLMPLCMRRSLCQ